MIRKAPPPDEQGSATLTLTTATEPVPTRLHLVVTAGPDAGRRLVLTRGAHVIGKSVGCDLTLSDGAVSQRHLEVVVDDLGISARDLDSRNGSFVEGTQFRAIALRVGAEAVIGVTTLRFELPETRFPAAARGTSSFGGLYGTSAPMHHVFVQCEQAARAEAPVLIMGETGTGKEVCACAIHGASARRDGSFVV